jgi:hypothetical protein
MLVIREFLWSRNTQRKNKTESKQKHAQDMHRFIFLSFQWIKTVLEAQPKTDARYILI